MAVIDGLKLARIRACHQCSYFTVREGNGWCGIPMYLRGDRVEYDGTGGALDPLWPEAADDYCPLGLWAGLDPVDREAEKQAAIPRLKVRLQDSIIDRALARLSDADAQDVLIRAVEAGRLAAHVAEALAELRGLDLTATV